MAGIHRIAQLCRQLDRIPVTVSRGRFSESAQPFSFAIPGFFVEPTEFSVIVRLVGLIDYWAEFSEAQLCENGGWSGIPR